MGQNQLFEQLIAQQAEGNPQFQAMLSLMRQANGADSETLEKAGNDPELEACKSRLARAAMKIREMRSEVEELNTTLSAMIHFGEDLAHAMGACTFCWGEDAGCRACRGRGKPGAFEPDPALFEKFVLPAYRRSKASLPDR